MWLLDKMLQRGIKRGELVVVEVDGTQHRYGAPDPACPRPVTIKLLDRRVAFDVARNPRLAGGEAYMDGRFEVEGGDIRDLALLVSYNAGFDRWAWLGSSGFFQKAWEPAAARLEQLNWRGRSRRNAEHTYDMDRRLYGLFLDEDRQYTCAYYRAVGSSLEQAQLDKKAHIAAKLCLRPGMKVLDIGCGWGGLALYLHRHYDVDVLGVTIAPDQVNYCRERAAAAGVSDRVKFELLDYREVEGRFDRIVNVGLIEHLGAPHHSGFFQKCRALLAPDGVMVSHCCGRIGRRELMDAWTRKYIFPGAYIPVLSELTSAAERQQLIVSDVEVLRYHYALTLHDWYQRTNAARDKIVALFDERFFRMWQFYLAGAEAGFRHGGLANFQIQYLMRPDSIPSTRDYMGEEEARLGACDAAPDRHAAEV